MLVEVEHLSKTFKNFTAVDNVTFGIEKGEMLGLLGPNGAGKTTTIHMILGLITPSAGMVRIFGMPFARNREEILSRANFSAPYVAFPNRLTVWENLMIFARIYKVAARTRKVEQLLELFGIEHLRHKPISRLSSGENTRIGLCKALMNDPELLLLDEPTAYLDPQAAFKVKEVLFELRRSRGITILYTSHNMTEVEELCDRIVFLRRGRVIATGTPIEVTQAILQEERTQPALAEAFMYAARGPSDEAA
jgi:ABC-2 type transport system ATP-binding protein